MAIKVTTVRLTTEQLEKLKQMAEADDRKQGEFMRRLIDQEWNRRHPEARS